MCKKKITTTIKTIGIFVLIVIVFIFIKTYRIMVVSGKSMEPTLSDGSFHIVKREFYYANGDIIVFKRDGNVIVKRIVASKNDKIVLNEDGIKINNVLQKSYIYSGNLQRFQLENNEYFVLGDNTYNSIDSRVFGVIKNRDIIGKLVK